MGSETEYWRSFGYEWTHFPRTQLDGLGQDESERTFRLKTGLTPEDIRGKLVLDVGCGAGRFLEVVSRWGVGLVIGIDASDAVESARANLNNHANVKIWRCAVEELLLTSGVTPYQFEVVYCIGVLHHTPDPAAAFRTIARMVKPGGLLCVWVYSTGMGSWVRIADLYRLVTTRLPWWLLRLLCLWAIPWHYVRRIPLMGAYLWHLFPCSTHPQWRWRWLDSFDWYSPKYQSKHTRAEVMGWFVEAGFHYVEALEFPVSVRGRKPE